MFEFEDLEAFVESAEKGTFSAAAHTLALTQPSLSRHIARLEHELGDRLFDRSNRRSPRLSPLGEALLPYARRLLTEHDRFAEISQAHTRGLDGQVTISLSECAGELALPTLYRYISRRFPRLQLKIIERLPGSAVNSALTDGLADLILTDSLLMSAKFEGIPFGSAEHVALGSSNYLGLSDMPIEWEAVRRLPLLLPMLSSEVGYPNARDLQIVQHGSGPGLLRTMARAGFGVAILAGAGPASGLHCRPISIDGVVQYSSFQLAWPQSSLMSAPTARLIEDLQPRLANHEPFVLTVDRTYDLLS
jgi:DNA-binding transcriptional LysR family regulator